MAKAAFGKVRDEQPSVVHDERNVHPRSHLSQDITHYGIQQELPELVLNRGDGLPLKARIIIGVLVLPKLQDERVFDLPDDPGSILFVGEQAIDSKKGSVLAIEERRHCIVEDVLQPRSP